MRIGISCEFLGVKRAGTATYTHTLLQGLAQSGGGHQYFPYLASRAALPLVPPAAHLSPRLVLPYNAWLRVPLTLPAELVRRPVDLLHAQGWGPLWAPCPMLLTVHDIGFETFPQLYPRPLALRLSLLVRHSVRRAAVVIASSRYTAADLQRIYGTPAAKIRVIYPAANPDIAPVGEPAELARVRARYGIAGPYVLYVGSIEPKKNVDRLIRIFAAFCAERGPTHRLVIVGKPLWLADEVVALPARLGIEREVIFAGQAPQTDLAALYSGAEAFAFLGMYEGFGYPPLEALACGTPVLAADRTSLPEVLGDAALLVDPEDEAQAVRQLARLLDDVGLRNDLRRRGRERARLFTLTAHTRQILAAYEEAGVGHMARQRGTHPRGRTP
jgi:glycosyltransferase involved in cell wall biosynthesis